MSKPDDERVELLRGLLREEFGGAEAERLPADLAGGAGQAGDVGVLRALAILEALFLVAAADGKLLRAELWALEDLLSRWLVRPLPPDRLERLVDTFAADLDRDDYDQRARAIAAVLKDEWARRAAFVVAAGVAHADGEVQDEERDVLELLAREFELKEHVVERILARARQQQQRGGER
jgi:tellurite resistance protein